jgi:hypothetical protein
MLAFESLIGLMIIGLTVALMLVFTAQARRSPLPMRPIKAMDHLARAVGLTVEDGRRVHITFGRGDFFDSHAASTLTNTALLKEVLKRSAGSDRPPSITSGDGISTLLAVDTLYSSRQGGISSDRIDPRRGRLAGTTPFSYAVGVLPALQSEQTSMMVAGGMLGAEISLILDTAETESVNILAAPDSPVGQAVAFACPVDALLGEEIYALPAYLNSNGIYAASLLTQDVLRWILIIFLIMGAILRAIGLAII